MIRMLCALAMFMPIAAAAEDASGSWAGTYTCGQGLTGVTLDIVPTGMGLVVLAHFFADRSHPRVPEGCFELRGGVDYNGHVALSSSRWISRPAGYVMVDLDGVLSADGRTLSGRVIGPGCTTFQLRRTKVPNPVSGVCQSKLLS